MFRIDTIITQHFKMLLWYVDNQSLDEFHGGDAFGNHFVIFVSGVMESNKIPIIFVNTGRSNYGSPKISCDVFDCGLGSAVIGFGSNIEAFLMILINMVFDFFEGRPQPFGKQIQKHFAESISEEGIVEVSHFSPWRERTCPALGNKSMDMGIPFQIPAESVEDADKTRGKIFFFIEVVEHAKYNRPDSMKQAGEKRTIFKEKDSEFFRNGENAVAMIAGDQLAGDV